ncbi:DNA-processing protein DprA [Periweissella beninensis]|uniref:DNA-processing protein DprA n=1 Tax=Periweissella beninensis TaxID=504936 RepID=UPI0021A82F6B|nr:DNA-processing protein DprA [Periweissella beninensis]MCT4395519.1 DNA-protecting protein DprA [Periweissella beninensis]
MKLRDYLLLLTLVPHIGLKRQQHVWQWLQKHPQATLPLTTHVLFEILTLPTSLQTLIGHAYLSEHHYQQAHKQGPFLAICDLAYPLLLKEIALPPLILFYQGDLRALKLPKIALVGSRLPDKHSYHVLDQLLPEIIAKGIGVVSGLAQGIDGWAHQLTIQHGGVAIGCIGTGLNQVYPQQLASLQAQVKAYGLVLSEYPLDTPPRKHHFPARNRIIAGLCQATVIVEARQKSGSLITANMALHANRNVLAIPGPALNEHFKGSNALLNEGAECVIGADNIIAAALNNFKYLP